MTQQRGPHHSKKCPFRILPNQPLSAKKSIARCVNCVSCNTYSSHQYYIENDRTTRVTLIEQEFKHRVMQTFPDEPGKSDVEEITKRNDDMTDTVKIPKKSSKRRYFTHEVDISNLDPGWYYIAAYTRINLKDVDENPTPQAGEDTKSTPFKIQ